MTTDTLTDGLAKNMLQAVQSTDMHPYPRAQPEGKRAPNNMDPVVRVLLGMDLLC
jgi:hypothetical protein